MAATATALKMPGASALPRSFSKVGRPIFATEIITPDSLNQWSHPAFQRPLIINEDVKNVARRMQLEAAEDREGMCTIPGTVEFGRHEGKDVLIDGQHRIHGAFAMASGTRRIEGMDAVLVEGGVLAKCALVDVKITPYETFAEMAEAFANFNKKLVALKPDDLLRAREESNPWLKAIRIACPFIGYDKNKNTKDTVMISMSAAIRTWFGSGHTPASGPECDRAQRALDADESKHIISFFQAAEKAGWCEAQYTRLWSTLNIGLNMWIWRKTVLGTANKFRGGTASMVLTAAQYSECMKELRGSAEYQKWLASRSLRFQDRIPTYDYIKELFAPALARLGLVGARFPQPQGWEGEK